MGMYCLGVNVMWYYMRWDGVDSHRGSCDPLRVMLLLLFYVIGHDHSQSVLNIFLYKSAM